MKVKVKDWGAIYTTYEKWFEKNNCTEYLEQYKQKEKLFNIGGYIGNYYALDKDNNKMDTTNMIYEVVKQGNHGSMTDRILYLIQEPITNKVYLIDKNGTEEVR